MFLYMYFSCGGGSTWVGILVVEVVDIRVKSLDMKEAVADVKVKLAPERNCAKPQDAVDRVFAPVERAGLACRQSPEIEHLKCSLDGNT
jgi:hypothetical protein